MSTIKPAFKSRRGPSWLTSKSLPLPRAPRSTVGPALHYRRLADGPLAPGFLPNRTVGDTLPFMARGQVGLYRSNGDWVAA